MVRDLLHANKEMRDVVDKLTNKNEGLDTEIFQVRLLSLIRRAI